MSNDAIKDALNRIPYGFYALTSKHGDDENAMVVNWVTQASFSPRRLAIGLATKAYSYNLIKESGVFTLNLFNADNQEAIMPFTAGRAKRPDKMTNATYTNAPETGCPVLEGASAYIEFKVIDFVDIGGDHELLVGEPIAASILQEGEVKETLTLPDVGWSYAG